MSELESIKLMEPALTRGEMLDQLIKVGWLADLKGLISASGGNLSARLPGESSFFITGTGTWLGELTPESFVEMNLDGEVVAGSLAPSSEYKLHLFTYQRRPDVNSIVHLHPQTTVLIDALGHEVMALTLDQASYLRDIGKIAFYPNGSDDLGLEAAKASAGSNVVVMAHHGCSSLGDTVGMAYRRALNLEDAARVTYQAIAAGRSPIPFPPEFLEPDDGGTV